jgi:hypothetical protein
LNAFPPSDNPPTTSGWRDQLLHPISGVLNARETAQGMAASQLVDLVKDGLPTYKGGQKVQLDIADFRFNPQNSEICKNPPLNWTLTAAQKACFAAAWTMLPVQEGKNKVLQYLGVK